MPDRAERGPELQGVGRICQVVVPRGATRERRSEETNIAPPLSIRHLAGEVALMWREARSQEWIFKLIDEG